MLGEASQTRCSQEGARNSHGEGALLAVPGLRAGGSSLGPCQPCPGVWDQAVGGVPRQDVPAFGEAEGNLCGAQSHGRTAQGFVGILTYSIVVLCQKYQGLYQAIVPKVLLVQQVKISHKK